MLAGVGLFVTIVGLIIGGYLVGSIQIANRVASRIGIGDLRTVGDHNPGYWNLREIAGPRAALPVLLGDAAKGAIAATAGAAATLLYTGRWWLIPLAGGAAMVGHAWPLWASFQGGRSVASFVGVGIVFSPLAAAVGITIAVLTGFASQRFAWGARAGIVAFPFAQLIIEGAPRTAATGVLMTLVGARFAAAAIAP